MDEILTEKVLQVRRIAVRENGVWRWFSDPVFTTLGQTFQYLYGNGTFPPADAVLELECQRAVAQYSLKDLKIVQAPSKEAMDLADLQELA